MSLVFEQIYALEFFPKKEETKVVDNEREPNPVYELDENKIRDDGDRAFEIKDMLNEAVQAHKYEKENWNVSVKCRIGSISGNLGTQCFVLTVDELEKLLHKNWKQFPGL